jgi:hypothetical protein
LQNVFAPEEDVGNKRLKLGLRFAVVVRDGVSDRLNVVREDDVRGLGSEGKRGCALKYPVCCDGRLHCPAGIGHGTIGVLAMFPAR